MHDKLFEAALGIQAAWAVSSVNFDQSAKVLTLDLDLKPGGRFAVPGHDGLHPVHDAAVKRYRHLNFFQHEIEGLCRWYLKPLAIQRVAIDLKRFVSATVPRKLLTLSVA